MSDLIDRQSLKNKICDCCEGKDEWCNGPCFEIMIIDSMPAIAASPRHRAEDEPKEPGKQYAVWASKGYAYCDKWLGDRWLISSVAPETVTHWMPIEPPKEDEHGN